MAPGPVSDSSKGPPEGSPLDEPIYFVTSERHGANCAEFVEVENADLKGISVGEWDAHPSGANMSRLKVTARDILKVHGLEGAFEVLNCAFCGFEYVGPDNPTPRDRLEAHINECTEHPLNKKLACPICGGSGESASDAPCACGGSGKIVDAFAFLHLLWAEGKILVRDHHGCAFAGPGRGDCESAVGLPGAYLEDPGHDGEDKTVDVYGRPNGWCWWCWHVRQRDDAQEKVAQLEEALDIVDDHWTAALHQRDTLQKKNDALLSRLARLERRGGKQRVVAEAGKVCPRPLCPGRMRQGFTVQGAAQEWRHDPRQLPSREADIVSVLKCDSCGHSVSLAHFDQEP